MTKHLEDLLEAAKKVVPTPGEKEQQRRSFAYGNTKIGNSRITREMVDRAADAIGKPKEESCRRSESTYGPLRVGRIDVLSAGLKPCASRVVP